MFRKIQQRDPDGAREFEEHFPDAEKEEKEKKERFAILRAVINQTIVS